LAVDDELPGSVPHLYARQVSSMQGRGDDGETNKKCSPYLDIQLPSLQEEPIFPDVARSR